MNAPVDLKGIALERCPRCGGDITVLHEYAMRGAPIVSFQCEGCGRGDSAREEVYWVGPEHKCANCFPLPITRGGAAPRYSVGRRADAKELEAWPELHPYTLRVAWMHAETAGPVFPCSPADKRPLVKRGFLAASRNPLVIEDWWTRWPSAMIGIPMGEASGLFAVDLDRKPDKGDGIATWERLVAEFGDVPTCSVRTPSGGRHLVYNWRPGIRNIPLGKLLPNNDDGTPRAPGIEIKGEGGYIIAAGSEFNGKFYEWENELPVVDPPEWLVQMILDRGRRSRAEPAPSSHEIEALIERHAGAGLSTAPADLPPPVTPERIRAALAVIDPDCARDVWIAIGGALYKGLGDEAGFEAWDEWSSTGRKYPGPRRMETEWRPIVQNAGYEWNIGTVFYHANEADPDWWRNVEEPEPSTEEIVSDVLRTPTLAPEARTENPSTEKPGAENAGSTQSGTEKPGAEKPGAPPLRSYFRWHGEPGEGKNISWSIKNLLKETTVGFISGQWGAYKTFGTLNLAYSYMSGEPFIDYKVNRKGGVLFIAAEGAGSIRLRLDALIATRLKRDINDPDIPKQPFVWIDCSPKLLKHGAQGLLPIVKEAAAEMRERFGVELVLIIIDTVAAAAEFTNENDAGEAQRVMNALWAIANESRTAVVAVDHFGKDGSTGTRGSSAKEANADTIVAFLGERQEDGSVKNARVAMRKVRDGEQGRVVPIRVETVDCGVDEDGDAISTLVLHWELDRKPEAKNTGGRPSKGRSTLEAAWTIALRSHENRIEVQGKTVRAAPLEAVRGEFIKLKGDAEPEAARSQWRRALEAALKDEEFKTDEVGGTKYLWPWDGGPF